MQTLLEWWSRMRHSWTENSSNATVSDHIISRQLKVLISAFKNQRQREYLLNHIQSQAEKIESLTQQLAEVTASSAKQKPPNVDIMMTDPEEPLIPSLTASGPYFGSISGSDSGYTRQDQNSDATANKAVSVCARCKRLKIRCEGIAKTEPCKRCMNGGHECVFPERKIRRVPP